MAGLFMLFIEHHLAHRKTARRSNLQYALEIGIRIIPIILLLCPRDHLAEQAVMRVALQYALRPRVLRLQSQQFVACFLWERTGLAELRPVLIPRFQRPLALFGQPLMFRANRCLDGELSAHFLSLLD
jgi:hypothetical protein